MELTTKHKKAVDNYQLLGFVFKRVCSDIENHLDGVLEGICAEVEDENNVMIYKLDRRGAKVKASKFLKWENGAVNEIKKAGRPYVVAYHKPENRSVGVFITSGAIIMIALGA